MLSLPSFRHLALMALLVLLVPAATAQVIETDPAFPTADLPLTVYFNAEGTGLEGYTGTVYTHTGVNTAEADWQCVIEAWGDNDTQPALTREGPDRYSLQIGDVGAFYDLENCEDVAGTGDLTGLAFVFRSADAASQSDDLFVEFSLESLDVAIVRPATDPLNPLIAESDTTFEVMAVASSRGTALSALRLLVEGTEVATTTNDTLTYDLTLDQPGRVDVAAIAEAGGQADTTYFYAVRNPEVAAVPRPEGLQDGITYSEDGTQVTLSLYAPGKEYAYVIGDLPGAYWEVDPDYFMQRDGDYLWTTIDGFTPGEEYPFQYLVDGDIRVTDPYAELVLTTNDQYIPEETYPGLMDYPEGLTEHVVGVLQPGEDEYDWQVEDFEGPAPSELVIYELLLRDFLEDHDYETLIDTLDYIEGLGVNAIELMPVSEFDGNESWGYNPSFHFALDKYYGTEAAFKRFIDAAHQRGIAVILDVVYNHATGQSPLLRLWNEGEFGAATNDNPYANPVARHPFNVFNDLNHESAATQYWLDRANEFWLEEYHIDGYRFDLTKGFMQSGSFHDYNQGRVNLLTRMTDEIWEVDPEAYVIFEHLGANDEEAVYAHYRTDEGLPGIMLWSNLNHNYNEATMGYHANGQSDLSWAHFRSRGWVVPNNVVYMESHDEERLMFRNLEYGNSANGYDVTELPTALDRMAMAGAFFYTIPGPKMLWQFGEVGYDVSIEFDCRTCNKPILWEEYWTDPEGEDVQRRDLYNAWSSIIHLRNAHEVFTHPGTSVEMATGGAVKRITLTHPFNGEEAVIVGNFDVVEQQISFTFPSTGTWYDFYGASSFDVNSPSRTMTLAPGEFHVFTSMEPAVGPITVDAEQPTDVDARFALDAVWPNPAREGVQVRYAVETPGRVTLEAFDMLGRRVAAQEAHAATPGTQTTSFSTADLPAGVYALRLTASGHTATQQIVVVR